MSMAQCQSLTHTGHVILLVAVHGVVDRLFLRLHDVENTGPFLEFSYQCVNSQYKR